jgi:hypothetical protein
LETHTDRERELSKELQTAKAKIVELTAEVETLRDLVKDLELVVAVLLATVAACFLVLSLFVSTTTIFALILGAGTLCFLLVKNFGLVLRGALRGAYRLLGPRGTGVVGAVLALWCYWGRTQLPPPCAPNLLHGYP